LERRNQVLTLEAELVELAAQVDERQKRREELSAELEGFGVRLAQAREERHAVTLNLSGLKTQTGQLERQLGETQRKLQSMEGEQAGAQGRFSEAVQRLEALEQEVNEALGRIGEQQERRQDLQGGMEALRAREAEAQAELGEMKVRVATEKQRHASLVTQREPMEARLRELGDLIEQREVDIEGYRARVVALTAESAEIEASLEGLRGRVGESEGALNALLSERSAVAALVEEEMTQVRVRRSELSGLVEKRSRLEVHLNQWEMKANIVEEHIRKRYQLEVAEFKKDLYELKVAYRDAVKRQRGGGNSASESDSVSETGQGEENEGGTAVEAEAYEMDWARIDALVREIDQRLDAMGPVNMEAIEEYEELEQRHVFLQQQHQDLLNAKAELLEVIAKINNTTRQLFGETFEKIRVNFQEMFTELFGGGKANLILTDPSDPLESGIEIIAKPPGKQLQSITLLSGGEKTMTAVSLLFSIYMVKPSPFCVLDEMDAPLDESNINRFIKILDRFVGQSQFVVISHNKKTIARADALYGVTMEEHGVSRLVGVKFTRRDESRATTDVVGTGNSEHVPSVAEAFGKSPNLHSEEKSEETA
jgi:chromosome segregation protein